jgi:hypothetical protein
MVNILEDSQANYYFSKQYTEPKHRAIRTPLKIRGDLRCSGIVNSSCSSSDIRRATLLFLASRNIRFLVPLKNNNLQEQ